MSTTVLYGVPGGLFQTGEAPIQNIVTDLVRVLGITTFREVSTFFGVN